MDNQELFPLGKPIYSIKLLDKELSVQFLGNPIETIFPIDSDIAQSYAAVQEKMDLINWKERIILSKTHISCKLQSKEILNNIFRERNETASEESIPLLVDEFFTSISEKHPETTIKDGIFSVDISKEEKMKQWCNILNRYSLDILERYIKFIETEPVTGKMVDDLINDLKIVYDNQAKLLF